MIQHDFPPKHDGPVVLPLLLLVLALALCGWLLLEAQAIPL